MLQEGFCEKYGNPNSEGRRVMITAPREESRCDLERPPLIRSPIMGKTGILPGMGHPASAVERFASDWRHCPEVGTRLRQMAFHEQAGKDGDLLQTRVERREDGGLYVVISINNAGNEDDLLAEVLLEMRRLRSAYGDMPSLVIIDKTGRYGLLPMLLPGQLSTYSLAGDLTEKKYLEFWMSLEAADTVFKTCNLGSLLGRIRYFAQMGMLSAATQPAIHFHPIESIDKNAKEMIPPGDRSVVDRLDDGEFGPEYVSKVIDEILVDKFLIFAEKIKSEFIEKSLIGCAPHLTGPFFGSMMDSLTVIVDLAKQFEAGKISIEQLCKIIVDDGVNGSDHLGTVFVSLEAFYADEAEGSNDLLTISRDFKVFLEGSVEKKQLGYNKKKLFWETQPEIQFPRTRLIFASSFMRSVKGDLEKVVGEAFETIPATARDRIKVVINDKFGNGFFPGVVVEASSEDMGLYAKTISAKCDEVLNKKWGKLFSILEQVSNEGGDRVKLLQDLDAELGLQDTLKAIKNDGVYFEAKPGFSLGRIGETPDEEEPINVVVDNYLNYLVECFGFAHKGGAAKKGKSRKPKPEIHNPRVCPRAMVVEKTEDGKFSFQVSPGIVFEPVAHRKVLESLIADFGSMKNIDSRLALLDNGFVAKSTGGDGFVSDLYMRRNKTKPSPLEGDYVFHILRELFRKLDNDGAVPAFFIHYLKKELSSLNRSEGVTYWQEFGSIFDELSPDEMHSIFQEDVMPDWFKDKFSDLNADESGVMEQAILKAKVQVEGKFRKAEGFIPPHAALRSVIAKNLSAVRVLIGQISPDATNGSEFEARYFFQLAVDSALHTITVAEYQDAKGSANVMDVVHGGVMRKKGPTSHDFAKNEEVFVEQFKFSVFAKYIVDKSFSSVFEARGMDQEDNIRAKAFLIEEVSHILEQMVNQEPNMIGKIVDEGDDQYFRKIAGFVATKLRKRGYNDEFYHSMLPEGQRKKEGHVDMVRNCVFDLDEIRKRFEFNDDLPGNISALVRRAVCAAYEIVDPEYVHGYELLDDNGVFL
ncbi:MAG: hypothetical protein WCX95_01920 [Candidatus Gracilibacteria bacterium]